MKYGIKKVSSKFVSKITITYILVVLVIFLPTMSIILKQTAEIVKEKHLDQSIYMVRGLDDSLQQNCDYFHEMIRQMNQSEEVMDYLSTESENSKIDSFSSYYDFLNAVNTIYYNNYSLKGIGIYRLSDSSYYYFSKVYADYYDKNSSLPPDLEALAGNATQKFIIEKTEYNSRLAAKCFKVSSNFKAYNNYKNIAVITFDVDVSEYKDRMKLYYPEGVVGYVFFVTPDGELLYDSSDQYDSDFIDFQKVIQEKPETVSRKGKEYFISVSAENELGCTVIHFVPKTIADRQMAAITNVTVIAVFAAISLIVMAMLLFNGLFSKRIKVLKYYLSEIQNGDLSVRIPLKGIEDEIMLVGKSINQMCEQLQRYIEHAYVIKLQQKDTELKLKNTEIKTLQAQINPHFLYNTLEMIRMKLNQEQESECASMILILSKLFRNSIKENIVISFREEIQTVKLFLRLYQLKYPELKTEFMIEDSILPFACVRSTLQPILENAVTHGYSEKSDFKISIRGYFEKESIIIQVADNGKGISKDRLEDMNALMKRNAEIETRHIGLYNVNNRIKLLFGTNAEMSVESTEGQGTCVTVCFPKRELGEFENDV